MRLYVTICLSFATGLLAGCWADEPVPTYNDAVRKIMHDNCALCHYPGGMAPISLVDYEDAHAFRKAIAHEIESGRMPPWLPARDCQPLNDDLALTETQRDTLLAWANGGAPRGPAPITPPEPFVPQTTTLPRIDLVVTMPTPYTPNPTIAAYDDFRCFLLDWPVEETTYIRGFEVIPGDPTLVHHSILFTVEADSVATYEALDAADPNPGWSCYGGAGDLPIEGIVSGWQPGQRTSVFPANTGKEIEPGSKLILNMHYNLLNANSTADQTELRFMLAESAFQAFGVPILDPGWLLGEFKIAAGDPDAVFSFDWQPSQFISGFGLSLTIHGASIHMHVLGKRAKIEVIKTDGSRDCLLDMPRWDFNWAGAYTFRQPYELEDGDRLYVECAFDNSAENQPSLFGQQIEPQDLTWDGIAPNEMCAGILLATLGF